MGNRRAWLSRAPPSDPDGLRGKVHVAIQHGYARWRLRNAIDHGIEHPIEQDAGGFAAQARIFTRCRIEARCTLSVSGELHRNRTLPGCFHRIGGRRLRRPARTRKTFWPAGNPGLHFCWRRQAVPGAGLPAWIRHHALLGSPLTGRVGHTTGCAVACASACFALQLPQLALTVAIHVAAIGEDNGAGSNRRACALRRTGDGQRAANLEHVRGPAGTAQRID